MEFARAWFRPTSHMYVARMLASACIFLYIVIFGALYFIGFSHGAGMEQMMGLTLGDHRDTVEYRMLAENMLHEGRFALSPEAPTEFGRFPGYPAFLAVVLTIFGTLYVVPFIQIVFTACTVALIYLMGARYFPRSVALFAAAIYMLDPIVIFAAWWPLSESLFILLFLGSIYAIDSRSKRPWLPFLLSGVLLGLSAYVRPLGQYMAPIIACMALTRASNWRVGLRNVAIFIVAAAAVMCPWFVRNYVQSGRIAFSSIQGWHFFINMSLFEQFRTGANYEDTQHILSEPLGTTDEHLLRQFEYTDRLRAIALPKYLAHPFEYTKFYVITAEKLFISSSIVKVQYHLRQVGILTGEQPVGEGAWGMLLQHRWREALAQTFSHLPRLLERIFWAFMYISAIITTLVVFRQRQAQGSVRVTWIICAFVLIHLYAATVAPWTDDTRYRMPIEPFVLLLGGYGVYMLWPRILRFLQQGN